ncbi:MAG: hypothetical protein J2P38_02500 [Candidatus Dormibacteraeota bacterium]|nr:hypothetical protein [Candidatus Dormibacteraeota bacterium]
MRAAAPPRRRFRLYPGRLSRELVTWRPVTLLDHLVAVAVVGIVVALALIVGVKFHILHQVWTALFG